MKKTVIVVLGMHRSGTSAITRSLSVLGVSLGDNLMRPILNNNDKGFFEDIDINALNIEMLNVIGSDWNLLSPIELHHFQLLKEKGYQRKAQKLLAQKIENHQLFAFKDPRVAKLMPFWTRIFEQLKINVKYLIVLRHPKSVVASLVKRDGLEAEHGYWLWLDHTMYG